MPSWNSNRIFNRPSNGREISSSVFGTTRRTRLYISRGKQPGIHQLAQYHSNNTELSSSDTFVTDFNIRAAAGTKSETHCKSCRHLENIKKLSNRNHQNYSWNWFMQDYPDLDLQGIWYLSILFPHKRPKTECKSESESLLRGQC